MLPNDFNGKLTAVLLLCVGGTTSMYQYGSHVTTNDLFVR